jgi:four helix bundle protein
MGKVFNLNERTLLFSIEIIKFSSIIDKNFSNKIILSQLIRSATSVGANYHEASQCNTQKDFRHKIQYCRKEAKETIYWLRLLQSSNIDYNQAIESLMQECTELLKIFSKISKG